MPGYSRDASGSLDAIVTQNRDIHSNLKNLLGQMRSSVEADEASAELKDEPETRMKRNFYLALTNELAKALERERIQEDSYKKCVKDKVARQVLLVDENLTQDQVDHYVNNPQEAEQMLQKRIYGMASLNLRNAVNDIQDKFRDIQKLERVPSIPFSPWQSACSSSRNWPSSSRSREPSSTTSNSTSTRPRTTSRRPPSTSRKRGSTTAALANGSSGPSSLALL